MCESEQVSLFEHERDLKNISQTCVEMSNKTKTLT